MKKINKYLILTIAVFGLLFQSCETLELELTENPNALSPDQADPAFLFNRIQMEYLFTVRTFNANGAGLGRINYLGATDYLNFADGGALNGPWTNFYGDMLPDIAALKSIDAGNPDLDLSTNIAIAEIMQAHVMSLLVDYLGDIVFSQANNPAEFPNPMLDDDAAVYAAAEGLLNNAKTLLGVGAPLVGQDLFGGPDWTKVANTILLRMNFNQGNYQAVVDATNVIEDTADDFEFAYGTNVQSPDNRHPGYATDYRDDGANAYQSNWLMHAMAGTWGDFFEDDDPRRRYYFYRQNAATPGNATLLRRESDGAFFLFEAGENAETLECSGNSIFPHLEFTPEEEYWCSVKIGYWGRDFMNSEGTPPDGSLRTTRGVYPVAGLFDDHDDFVKFGDFDGDGSNEVQGYVRASVFLGAGGGGNGITPIYLASYVDFMKAAAALLLNDDATAATFMESAITKSVAKVQTFGSRDPNADLTKAPSADRVTAFIADRVADFNAAAASTGLDGLGFPTAPDKMDILSEQYFIAMYGAGADAFNFIRITGYPRTMPRGWEPNRGLFPRTFLYPSGEASTNPNVIQRADTQTRVFWDNGATSPAN